MGSMGFDFGLEKAEACIKRKFRWLFRVPNISAEGIECLPPLKGARPNINFKEIQVEHLNETIFLPGKPDWKPINLVLYDLKTNRHPIFTWLKQLYNPCDGTMTSPVARLDGMAATSFAASNAFIKLAYLEVYDGCGEPIETWTFENVWPNNIDFGDLDMGSSEVLTCDLTLRYARAYMEDECD